MDKNLTLVVLRFMASLARAAGQASKGHALSLLADMVESGKKVDAHMEQLALRLKDDQYDWAGAVERIHLNSEW